MDDYAPIPSKKIVGGVDLLRPDAAARPRVTVDSPATAVMTDLTRVDPGCIDIQAPMDEANLTMIRLGVRMLFVQGTDAHLAGIITATDILGEKPMRLVQERGLRHDEITVGDLMTPIGNLDVLSYSDVSHAQVGHVIAALGKAGRQHTLVVERGAGGRQLVRGIFSTSHISRQLGMPIAGSKSAPTLSELVIELGDRAASGG